MPSRLFVEAPPVLLPGLRRVRNRLAVHLASGPAGARSVESGGESEEATNDVIDLTDDEEDEEIPEMEGND